MTFTQLQSAPLALDSLNLQMMEQTQGSGAHVTFIGSVRDYNSAGNIDGIELEHYPGMTEKALKSLAEQAKTRFDCDTVMIVHRIGKIENFQPIVWVGAASQHRQAAFDAVMFAMDALKQSVPLWKKEWRDNSATWVEAKQSDENAFGRW